MTELIPMTPIHGTMKLDLASGGEFFTDSGLPMAEYVPQDYERSDVEYATVMWQALEGRDLNLGVINHMPCSVEGVFLAGGYVADLLFNAGLGDPNDIDIFFDGKESFEKMYAYLLSKGLKVQDPQLLKFVGEDGKLLWTKEFEGAPYITLVPPFELRHVFGGKVVQLVKIRWYESAEHVIDSFDFTVVQAAIDLHGEALVFNPMGAVDYSCRRLIQHRVESHARVSMRLAKYESKGFHATKAFTIPSETVVKLVESAQQKHESEYK
jgi:hypothetical protein